MEAFSVEVPPPLTLVCVKLAVHYTAGQQELMLTSSWLISHNHKMLEASANPAGSERPKPGLLGPDPHLYPIALCAMCCLPSS